MTRKIFWDTFNCFLLLPTSIVMFENILKNQQIFDLLLYNIVKSLRICLFKCFFFPLPKSKEILDVFKLKQKYNAQVCILIKMNISDLHQLNHCRSDNILLF